MVCHRFLLSRILFSRKFLPGLLFLGLAGCTQNASHVAETFKTAVIGPDQTTISADYVEKLPYASTYIKFGDNPPALLILTGISNTHPALTEKWLSANKELVVTRGGRVIKTLNLMDGNLVSILSSQPDPLILGLQHPSTPKEWHYQISWQPGYHWNYQAVSTFTTENTEEKQLITGKKTLLHVVENVTIPIIKQQYQNDYWINPQTGKTMMSEQHLYPGSEKILLSVAKPYHGDTE